MAERSPYRGPYGRWYRRARDWKMVFLIVPLVAIVGFFPLWSWYLPTTVSHRRKPDAAALSLADRFARALFVTQDCRAAQALESGSDLVDRCGQGSTVPAVQGEEIGPYPGTDFDLVRDSGAIVPHCKFVGPYARYGQAASERDSNGDACIAFRLIARNEDASEAPWLKGYLALYTVYTAHAWHVGTWWVEGETCVSRCATVWARRVPPIPFSRAPTPVGAAGLREADRFVDDVFVLRDCRQAAALAVPWVGLDLTGGCIGFGGDESSTDAGAVDLVSRSARISPGCSAGYPAEPTFSGDDTCVAYELVESVGVYIPQYQRGYVAVYLARGRRGWVVSGYTSGSSDAICGRRCNGIWARREGAR